MAERHSTNGSGARAVYYLRMSTDRQEKSIPAQRSELKRYARQHNYEIVSEYLDSGISGDRTEKRLGFLQMRDDCSSGKFSVVLCWDQDRFGRFDLLDAGKWIAPFREAGVRLETLAQGAIDWEDLVGQLIYSVNQLGKAQFLRDLSRNVCRGQLAKARAGKGTGGNRIPYGYRAHKVRDDQGRLIEEWLVVESSEAKIVREIFDSYLQPGGSLRGIAIALNEREIVSPSGGKWYAGGVRYVLTNRKYTGAFVWGRQGTGTYHSSASGEVLPQRRGKKVVNGSPIVHEAKHEAIVETDVFVQAQDRLARQRKDTRKKESSRVFLLSGLLKCGDCEGSLVGQQSRTKTGSDRYVCRTYCAKGSKVCYCNSIAEAPLVGALVRKIEEEYLSDEAIARLRKAIKKEQGYEREGDSLNRTEIRRRIERLEKKIDNGLERALEAPSSIAGDLYARIEKHKGERDRLHEELDKQPAKRSANDKKEVEQAIKALRSLRRSFAKAEPENKRELLRSFVDRVELQFKHTRRGKLAHNIFDRATVYLRPDRLSLLYGTGRRCATC